jgi:hypothetical protein
MREALCSRIHTESIYYLPVERRIYSMASSIVKYVRGIDLNGADFKVSPTPPPVIV